MSTGLIVGLVVAVIVVALVGFVAWTQMRRRHLRERFGPEYDRAVEGESGRRMGERELLEREKRFAELEIRPLSDSARDRYAREWARVQEQFVDQPGEAVAEADRLVAVVMAERGYPTEDYEQRVADLSVRHANTLDHYRTAHDVKIRHDNSTASTEELREAMVHYRAMFQDLLEPDGHSGHAERQRRAERR